MFKYLLILILSMPLSTKADSTTFSVKLSGTVESYVDTQLTAKSLVIYNDNGDYYKVSLNDDSWNLIVADFQNQGIVNSDSLIYIEYVSE